jgi:hypothetical protein
MRTPLLLAALAFLAVAPDASLAKVVHRWSFTSDASDSVGGANAVLQGGAAVQGGKLVLDGQDDYAELPIGRTVEKLGSITIEAWVTWAEMQGAWARIFDFGTGQQVNMFLTPRAAANMEGAPANVPRLAMTTGGFAEEEQINADEPFPTEKEVHVAVTIDGEKGVAKMFIDGKLIGTTEDWSLKPSALGNTTNNYLGGSQYFETDPVFHGTISEFRIHDAALSEEQIAQNTKLGPDRLEEGRMGEVVATTERREPTESKSLSTMIAAAPGVAHRWSFAENANDSVGNANATLAGGATVDGGRLVLNGQRAHAQLPIGEQIEKLTNSTFEMWVTWDERQRAWVRFFDFGSRGRSMYITPRNGRSDQGSPTNTLRFTITTSGDAGEQQINSADEFPVGTETHVALTIDADRDVARLYVNGKQVGANEKLTLSPSDLGRTANNWLGRSQFPDPYFKGSINEFRIYNKTLTPEEVEASFKAGPDKLGQ